MRATWGPCCTSCPTCTRSIRTWCRRRPTCTRRSPPGSAPRRGPSRSSRPRAARTPSRERRGSPPWAGSWRFASGRGRQCARNLLSDAFHPERWWKLIDLHRDLRLARAFHAAHLEPLLRSVPAPGTPLRARWDAALDALSWPELPCWRDAPTAGDDALALRAVRALHVRTERAGRTFRAARAHPPGPIALDVGECLLRAPWPGCDAVGAPPRHPYPPALCAARNGKTPALPSLRD